MVNYIWKYEIFNKIGSQITLWRQFKLKMKIWEYSVLMYVCLVDCAWKIVRKSVFKKELASIQAQMEVNRKFPNIQSLEIFGNPLNFGRR